ncbi:MAG: TonB-dependent receptor [Prevotellaceae bacterium]|jgi:TonB-linked SusC/RagA family outer membrane protein|nr:TonB-dependent receptor [Prevotellaceae bacterium]
MRIKIILVIFLMSLCSGGFAQIKKVTGHVKDANDGSPLSGASVVVKNTTNGVVTDTDGAFAISVSDSDTLVFFLMGKKEVVQIVGSRTTFEITLADDEEQLEEVTVVAFGTQKKSSVVSSITTVKPSELRVPAHNFTSGFAGRIPGMISYQTSGEPGNDLAEFFIRGVTTFGYTKSPLILIDGFESSPTELARLQVDDLESFSIFKDASAAALYGARGANGVLYVITKSGKQGAVSLNVRLDTHIATPTKMIEMVDGVRYMRLYNEGVVTRDPLAGKYYNEQKIQSTINNENPMIYPNVDWYGELFDKTTVNKRAYLSLSGGGTVAKYHVSGGFENENGLLKEDPLNKFDSNIRINRVHMRSNVVFELSKTTTLDTRIQAEFERYNGPFEKAVDIFGSVMDVNPVDFPAVYEPDAANRFTNHTLFGSTLINGNIQKNPYAEMVKGYRATNTNIVTAMATLRQNFDFITKGLIFEGKMSVKTDGTTTQTRSFKPFYYSVEQYNQITQQYKLYALNRLAGDIGMGEISATNSRGSSYYFEGRLNWNRRFGVHNLGAMAVGTMQENANLVAGTVFTALPARNMGLSGRATYDYDDRYFLEFNFGYNGSEKFTGDKRYGFFPSVGLAYMISNEKFWEPMKPVINLLKLRATYGKNGNDGIAKAADRFNFISDITKSGGSYVWGLLRDHSGSGYSIKRYANANISWEVARKINFGMEISALNNMFKFQIDAWKDFRSEIYQERKVFAATTGLIENDLKIFGNVGKVESTGFESSLDIEKMFNNSAWLMGRFNFTYSTNKVIFKDEEQFRYSYQSAIGKTTNLLRGLVAERLFVDAYEVANSPRQDWGFYEAGDIKYKDVNNDGRVDNNDAIPMGYPSSPEIQYGFGLSGGFKNFDVSFFFQGNSRVSFFIDPDGIAPLYNHRNALEIVARDYWTETNPNVHAFWPRLSTSKINNNVLKISDDEVLGSSWWLRDGTFLRLKTVELGYNIKNLKKLLLQSGRVYFSVENVFYISTFKLWDPEMGNSGRGYPPNRRFNIGLQLQF